MHNPSANDPASLQPGEECHGYRVERRVNLETIRAELYELEHLATGARHIHLANQDRENTFSVIFRTIPRDSTGVAHILEHTVLCGSRKFPVRDPFFSMIKRSLNTFMNAFTASDWTMYPFCTQNRRDYYNLMDVYLDSTFFPNLGALSFQQEGHRLEPVAVPETRGGGRLVYKGVVYNEMKGAMSSPDQVMVRSMLNALYPDTTYSFNSGGDPAVIPELAHADLKAFHAIHYHPSNALFYTYGNLPLADHLAFIEGRVLSRFARLSDLPVVASQKHWKKPRAAVYTYPLEEQEGLDRKCQVSVAWLLNDICDSLQVLSLTLLEQILLGNPASPLRKALIDSGMGTALADGTGYDADNRDTLFACGLKDVQAEDADAIETLVLTTLASLAAEGIENELVASAIHQLEFHRREVTNTPYPYGLKLLLGFAGPWLHGGDPVAAIAFDRDLATIRSEIAKGPYFEGLIRRWLLDNSHRVRLLLRPDPEKTAIEKQRVADHLEQVMTTLAPAEIDALERSARDLEKLQQQTEDVACLPTLELGDIPPEVSDVDPRGDAPETMTTFYEQPTSGIFYLSAALGAGDLPDELVPLVPFFCYAFTRTGTHSRDYLQVARHIDRYTGGLAASVAARTAYSDSDRCMPMVSVSGKCLAPNLEPMMSLATELMEPGRFTDLERLKNLVLEYRTHLESAVIHNGHRLAMSLAGRNLSPARQLGEVWSGVHQVRTMKEQTGDLSETSLADMAGRLCEVAAALFSRENCRLAAIGEEHALAEADGHLAALRQALATGGRERFAHAAVPSARATLLREGWRTSSAVAFVAQVQKAVRMDHEDAAALAVIAKLMRSLYLHREIREKGGAYGGFALYNPEDGTFSFASYRDPHIRATLDAFEGARAFVAAGDFGSEDIKEAILQVCSEIDKPDPPGPAARKAYYRRLIGLSREQRLAFKHRLLAVDGRMIGQAAANWFIPGAGEGNVAVIAGDQALQGANEKLADPLALFTI